MYALKRFISQMGRTSNYVCIEKIYFSRGEIRSVYLNLIVNLENLDRLILVFHD